MTPLKLPTNQTSEPALGPSYLAKRYEYKIRAAKSHANQMIDISRSGIITGWYAEEHFAQLLVVTDSKCAGIGAEYKHYGAKGRGKHRQFVCGNHF